MTLSILFSSLFYLNIKPHKHYSIVFTGFSKIILNLFITVIYYLFLIVACAAASLAIGTLYGEQDT